LALGGPAAATAASAKGQPLTLAEAEAQAILHQPAMTQARAQTDAAEGRVEQARAGYLPQVGIAVIYQRTTGNFVPQPGTNTTMGGVPVLTARPYSNQTFNIINASATASQLIYDFGQTSERWNAAESSRDAFRASETSTTAQVVLGVRRAYFQARAQRDLVDVAAEAVLNQEKHLSQIEAFVNNGIRPQIDLAQARTAVANANVQLVAAQNNYAVSMAQLNQAMGVPADTTFVLADSDMPPVAGEGASSGTLVTEALKARPELAVLARQREAQAETVRSLEGGYGPSLSANAAASSRGEPFDNLGNNWYVGATLSWALFQGGLTKGQVREAKGNLNNIDGQTDAMRLQVQVEVEQARLGVAAAKSSITAADEALVNAREQLRLAEARYQNGLGSVIELGDAQVAFSNAEAQEVQAKYGLATARAQLMTAMGMR
jgi:outer membrane protein